jgi:hypothetical protein
VFRKTPRQIADERFGRGRDRAARQSVEPKWPVPGANQAGHVQAVMREQPFDLPIFPLPQHDRQPAIGALTAIDRRFGRPVANAVDCLRPGKIRDQALINFAVDADTIRPGKLLRGMFEKTREFTVIGEQEKTFAIDIKASNRNQARKMPRQVRKNGRAALRIARGRNQSRGLVIQPKPSRRCRCDRLAIDSDAIIVLNRYGGMRNDHVVQRDAAGRDQAFRVAARRDPGAREILSQSFALHRLAF